MACAAKRPATLLAALQINGEKSLFSPDFISPTIKTLFRRGGLRVSPVETYFIESVYRSDPKQYAADEQILQFSVSL